MDSKVILTKNWLNSERRDWMEANGGEDEAVNHAGIHFSKYIIDKYSPESFNVPQPTSIPIYFNKSISVAYKSLLLIIS